MTSNSRVDLVRRINECLAMLRLAADDISRNTALHKLLRLEAELAAMDRAASPSRPTYEIAAIPVGPHANARQARPENGAPVRAAQSRARGRDRPPATAQGETSKGGVA